MKSLKYVFIILLSLAAFSCGEESVLKGDGGGGDDDDEPIDIPPPPQGGGGGGPTLPIDSLDDNP